MGLTDPLTQILIPSNHSENAETFRHRLNTRAHARAHTLSYESLSEHTQHQHSNSLKPKVVESINDTKLISIIIEKNLRRKLYENTWDSE